MVETAEQLARVPMADAIAAARATVGASTVHGEFTAAEREPSPGESQKAENSLGD